MKQEIINLVITILSGMSVDGRAIPVFDYIQPSDDKSEALIQLTTYDEAINSQTFCGDSYDGSLLIDIITRFPINFGARWLADAIRLEVIERMGTAAIAGMIRKTKELDTDLVEQYEDETVYRNLIRYNFSINRN